MSRTADQKKQEELREAILQYVIQHGLVDLSLRPLAKAVGSSPRVLLYYFGSKEKIISQVLAELRERQGIMYGQINQPSFEEAFRNIWQHISSPDFEPYFRLFFEAYGIALRQPQLFTEFLQPSIEDWLVFAADQLRSQGYGKQEARILATTVLAGFRGFMLDLCATHDRKRVNHAVSLWLSTLNLKLPKKLP